MSAAAKERRAARRIDLRAVASFAKAVGAPTPVAPTDATPSAHLPAPVSSPKRRKEKLPSKALGFEEQRRALLRDFQTLQIRACTGREGFARWLEAVWAYLLIPLAAVPKEKKEDPDESGLDFYVRTLTPYSGEEGERFSTLMWKYFQLVAVAEGRDILGPIFQELFVTKHEAEHDGLFFTPWNVAEMMAEMSVQDDPKLKTATTEDPFTVMDPACGSGVLLLATGRTIRRRHGEEALNRVQFFGVDINPICVAMARIQLLVNGLDQVGTAYRLATGRPWDLIDYNVLVMARVALVRQGKPPGEGIHIRQDSPHVNQAEE